jgi:uncharacterized RDD family membrane protein YckC
MVDEQGPSLTIRTPEGVAFSLHPAGPVTRFLAWSIDLACIGAISKGIGIAAQIAGVLNRDMAAAFQMLAYFVVSVGYGIAMEWHWRGQTLGKRLLHLRVMDENGLRLRFNQIVMRNLMRFVDSLPAFYLVGGVGCLVSLKGQRPGDMAANTIVVRIPRVAEPDLNQITGARYNSLRDHPLLAARLRRRISPPEADIALQAVLRRDELAPAARMELFGDLAAHFKEKVSFPDAAVEGISDEQYVRNVADLLFRADT